MLAGWGPCIPRPVGVRTAPQLALHRRRDINPVKVLLTLQYSSSLFFSSGTYYQLNIFFTKADFESDRCDHSDPKM